MKLELLAPAKNLEFGREAINHGADALYIGAPAFGARAAATNTVADIEALARYAHLYGCKVFTTVNTILFDHELEPAVAMIRQLYNAGVDALIIQDLGLLECDLPPIELHASTQCHNASVERIKFMESAGFKRIILARETSLEQMRQIRAATNVDLEAFVHGALCVSYSGQCYMSQYLNGRSGNRGCCSQPCRSTYDLVTGDGRTLVKERHLLSLKDFNASQQLADMIDAGISSFKIEGRLKDLGYVKNITAHYRRLLDGLMERESAKGEAGARPLEPASSGHCTFFFEPDPERTFNRGYTDYFLRERQPMASLDTQKSIGKAVGTVVAIGRNSLKVSGNEVFTPGDGLCFFDAEGRLQGFLVNQADGNTMVPNRMPDLQVGTPLRRNHDQAFERLLQGRTAIRKIAVTLTFGETADGFALEAVDADGLTACGSVECAKQPALHPDGVTQQISRQLSKLGDTPFEARQVSDTTEGRWFVPAATLNQLRRDTLAALEETRTAHFRPADTVTVPDADAPCPTAAADYRANVINQRAEAFYRRHGASTVEHGLEETLDYDGKALMTTRYCLRYELDRCRKKKVDNDTLLLRNNGKLFRLEFDCRQCLMRIYKA